MWTSSVFLYGRSIGKHWVRKMSVKMKFSKTASDGGSVMETRRKQAFILRVSPIGFFAPVIPRVIFGIPPPAHTFNPKSRSDFALKSRIPSFKWGKSRIPKNLLRTLFLAWQPLKNLEGVKKIFLCLVINLKFLSRVNSLGFSLSARASIQLTFRVLRTSVTCTLDSHSKTPPSGLDLAQSVERSFM